MGQKTHPYGFRLGYIKDWKAHWFANKKEFSVYLLEDIKIKRYIKKSLSQAAVSSIVVDRTGKKVRVSIYSARPGIIIGRRGSEIDKLKEEIQEMTGGEVIIDIKEIKNPAIEAQLVAENIAFQLEKRIPFRRAMKKAVSTAMGSGAGGIKIRCAGRLGGAEIARTENYKKGKVPLQTLRADIDYGFAEAMTTYGIIGVKVWVYKGDILPKKDKVEDDLVGTDAQKG
ncbi:MAG: 30S ribosomal protein S3 [Candidatus Omnitrophica bacterium CG07_land_8_20_14_0_80_42_15]|uniref:Small ribosomal subunit protein uS3 n=1 Tax=Candidatus Aquitaenariimonas noxiae TaxID=1974741 RepID=A0A2J0KYM3_9BACT|nr:MAG: 30S ribosomal protein S3 [Candidatus Omnitrophica bacterium CG07_land_8_20_14_0_80_42_15]